MTATPLPDCTYCGRSAWGHPYRGAWMYCDEVGGHKSPLPLDVVNTVRATVGHKPARRNSQTNT